MSIRRILNRLPDREANTKNVHAHRKLLLESMEQRLAFSADLIAGLIAEGESSSSDTSAESDQINDSGQSHFDCAIALDSAVETPLPPENNPQDTEPEPCEQCGATSGCGCQALTEDPQQDGDLDGLLDQDADLDDPCQECGAIGGCGCGCNVDSDAGEPCEQCGSTTGCGCQGTGHYHNHDHDHDHLHPDHFHHHNHGEHDHHDHIDCGCDGGPGDCYFEIHSLPVPNQEVDPVNPEETLSTNTPVDLSETFKLHSNPGAQHTIYLDFDGHTTSGTSWNTFFNSGQDFTTPAYDTDGNAASFSDTELRRIQWIWERVSEDFLPFDVNVTTEDPGAAALMRSGGGDSAWGNRVVIGGSSYDWYGNGAGGVAYLGSFDWSSDTPSFVFEDQLANGNEKYTAEATSHEIGHTLGLSHDGRSNPSEGYYTGHSSGETGWAPLMGASYYRNVTQWSKGEYANANQQQDDLSVITTGNGFSYRTDDHGNDGGGASSLAFQSSAAKGWGIIERTTDVDVFELQPGTGSIQIDVNPHDRGPNLDVFLELYDSVGTLIASANPSNALSATINAALSSQKYFLHVSGTGNADPASTGYSAYASLGQFFVDIAFTPSTDEAISIAADTSAAAEGDSTTNFTFQVSRTGDASDAATVAYAVTGTGASPANAADFVGGTLPSGSVSFAVGETTKTITIAVAGDSTAEDNELFTVTLASPSTGYVLGTSAASSQITDDDSSSSTVQIIDNGSAGFQSNGNWGHWGLSGHAGGYQFAGPSTTNNALWTFNVQPGTYQISGTWLGGGAHASHAPVGVYAGGSQIGNLTVDQRQSSNEFMDAGSGWENLGTFTVTSSVLQVALFGNSSGYIIADAIRIEQVTQSSDQIVDNSDAGFSTTGSWGAWNQAGFEGDYRFAAPNAANTATWSFDVQPGTYRLSGSWIPSGAHASNAAVSVRSGGNTLGNLTINQTQPANDFVADNAGWEILGVFTVTGNSLEVVLSGAGANGAIVADAMRIEEYTAPTEQVVDNSGAGFSTTGGWGSWDRAGFQGNYQFAGANAANTATWSFQVQPGTYRLSGSWIPSGAHASNAAVTVRSGSSTLGNLTINQAQPSDDFVADGAGWETLGVFTVTGSSLEVVLSGAGANGAIVADAMRIEAVTDTHQIIDNGSGGFSTTGPWSAWNFAGHEGDYLYSAPNTSSTATWTFHVTPGTYQIAGSWTPSGAHASDTPLAIYNGSSLAANVTANQRQAPDDFTSEGTVWETLSTLSITGNTITVVMSDAADGYVISDAIRIERVGSAAQPNTPEATPTSSGSQTYSTASSQTQAASASDRLEELETKLLSLVEQGRNRQASLASSSNSHRVLEHIDALLELIDEDSDSSGTEVELHTEPHHTARDSFFADLDSTRDEFESALLESSLDELLRDHLTLLPSGQELADSLR